MKTQIVLDRLRADHALFERVFCDIECQCEKLSVTGEAEPLRLAAAIWFLHEHEKRYHHEIEERIGRFLNQILTRYAQDIYDLPSDHAVCCREFKRFRSCVDAGVPSGCTTDELLDRAKSYIGCERAHLISEEELFFPYAQRYLTLEQWHTVNHLACVSDLDISTSPFAKELALIFDL